MIDYRHAVAQPRLERARLLLRRRGPNFLREWRQGSKHIMHAALHITGSDQYYRADPEQDFCAFAGEIYNYGDWPVGSDAELVHDIVRDRIGQLKKLQGPASWIYGSGDWVCYASDAQGERHLYRYHDDAITVVASEPALILAVIDCNLVDIAYDNKTWSMPVRTPYRGIERLESGRLYINHAPAHMIDSIYDWYRPEQFRNIREAVEQFGVILHRVIQQMHCSEPVTISFSGGIDSSLLSDHMPDANLLSLDVQGKDPNIADLPSRLNQHQQQRHVCVSVSPAAWAGAWQDMMQHTAMPAQSWSHVSKWIVARHSADRVIFTGSGADELFGGYAVYQDIEYDELGSHSPYSTVDQDGIWPRCLMACDGDPRQATLLCDYVYQVVSCDSQGWDRAAGAWSREVRHPFMHPDIVKFALSLPWEYKVGDISKPVLRASWQRAHPEQSPLPKQGFAGHANDSAAYLGIEADTTKSRHQDWHRMCRESFYDRG